MCPSVPRTIRQTGRRSWRQSDLWRLVVHSRVYVLLVEVVIIKEPAERKLKESVVRLARVHKVIAAPRILRVVHLVRIHRVKVARVRRVLNLRHVRRLLGAQVLAKVNALEEWVRLDFVGILAQATVSATAEL